MNVTLGEVANELMPYSNLVDISYINDFPFLRAFITGGEDSCTRCYMYIVQTGDNEYAACHSHDITNGERFLPTGNTSKPFISEKDLINQWFDKSGKFNPSEYKSVKTNMSYTDFMFYLYKVLFEYDLIKFDSKYLNIQITNLVSNIKCKRAIEKCFEANNCESYSVEELITIVNINKVSFELVGLKSKDEKVFISKLKEIGLRPIIRDGYLIRINFEKYKYKEAKKYVSTE